MGIGLQHLILKENNNQTNLTLSVGLNSISLSVFDLASGELIKFDKSNFNNPLSIDDFEEFLDLHFNQSESVNSWTVKHKDINQNNYDLAVQNPNKVEVVDKRTPNEIILEIEQLDAEASEALKAIKELL